MANKTLKEIKEKKLNLKQEAFCNAYVSSDGEIFGNGVYSYCRAYGMDFNDPKKYMLAASSATRLLKNVKIIERITQLLQETGFNDQFADKQLGFLMAQHADFQSKLGAIKEYNKLKGRITEKSLQLNVTLPTPIYGSHSVQGYDGDTKDIQIIKKD